MHPQGTAPFNINFLPALFVAARRELRHNTGFRGECALLADRFAKADSVRDLSIMN